MKKIRTILIDDEPLCTQGLAIDIEKTCSQLEVIATFNDPRKAVDDIKKLKPDLIFLDIEMPWLNGFEFLEACRPFDFHVIFVTAYDEFAVQAFRSNVVDYLMKPILRVQLAEAVDKTIEQIQKNSNYIEQIESVINAVNTKIIQKIAVPNSNGYDLIPIKDIIYCQAQGNYTEIYSDKGKKTVTKVLKSIEGSLGGHNFLRVHASYLVNIERIESIYRNEGGYVIMENGKRISISRNKKGEIFDMFKP